MGGTLFISKEPKLVWVTNGQTYRTILEPVALYMRDFSKDLSEDMLLDILGHSYLLIEEFDEKLFNIFLDGAIKHNFDNNMSYYELVILLKSDPRSALKLDYPQTGKIIFGKDSVWVATGWVYDLILSAVKSWLKHFILDNYEDGEKHLLKATRILEKAQSDYVFDFASLSVIEQKYFVEAFSGIYSLYVEKGHSISSKYLESILKPQSEVFCELFNRECAELIEQWLHGDFE